MGLWERIAEDISAATGRPFRPEQKGSVGGGCINETYSLEGDGQRYFIKLHNAGMLDMFEAEAEGLNEMVSSEAIRVPRPIAWGTADGRSFLAMEYIRFGGRDNAARFGEELARMHQKTRPQFGWHRDNTIGSTPQINTPAETWVDFWREHRLGFQLDLAASNGCGGGLRRKGEALLESFPALFSDYQPEPSLLHGDLWGGNMNSDSEGNPVIFDPAVYYGDREADLAMTELFGGPGRDFYAAYDATWPIDPGYSVRKQLYNLYHILTHFNLFGGGYAGQAQRMTERLLSELR